MCQRYESPCRAVMNDIMNDIFYFKKKASIYNYVDDITVSYSHKNLNILKEVLVDESATCIEWFRNNEMQANPDKFQAIMLGKSGFENCKSLCLNGTDIKCEDSVKVSKGAKIRNRYNQVPHLTQDTNGKVTNSQ